MALMCLSPLSGEYVASFPHVLESSCRPPVPKPIRESQEPQSFCSLAVMPILALDRRKLPPTALNPSLLQLGCKDQSSYRGRSWRRMCSSRLVTWSLGNQSQSCLQQSYNHFCCSRIGNSNGKFSERQELHF